MSLEVPARIPPEGEAEKYVRGPDSHSPDRNDRATAVPDTVARAWTEKSDRLEGDRPFRSVALSPLFPLATENQVVPVREAECLPRRAASVQL